MENQEDRALAGKLFDAGWPEYRPIKARTHDLCRRYNLMDEEDPGRDAIIHEIFGTFGENGYIRGPLQVNVGFHTRVGDRFFANFNATILDDVAVMIGDDAQFGPNVTIVAGTHPLVFEERRALVYPDGHVGGAEYGDPVVIGNRVWIGANVVVLPGVTIGDDVVVGAGSIVTKDIPPGYLAYGSPCRAIRRIGPDDSMSSGSRW